MPVSLLGVCVCLRCTGESECVEVSQDLIFLELDLHRQFLLKLRVLGRNAAFALRSTVAFEATLVVATMTATAVYCTALPPPPRIVLRRYVMLCVCVCVRARSCAGVCVCSGGSWCTGAMIAAITPSRDAAQASQRFIHWFRWRVAVWGPWWAVIIHVADPTRRIDQPP